MTDAGGGQPLGAFLFSIAILADTHLNEAEYESNSPFECNRMANARTRWVIDAANECQPAVTLHLGDLVHPVPTLPTYADAADHFKRLIRVLQSPLHLVPGNHDVGDKPVVWAPSSARPRWHGGTSISADTTTQCGAGMLPSSSSMRRSSTADCPRRATSGNGWSARWLVASARARSCVSTTPLSRRSR